MQNHRITIRCSQEQKAEIKAAAEAAKSDVTKYLLGLHDMNRLNTGIIDKAAAGKLLRGMFTEQFLREHGLNG